MNPDLGALHPYPFEKLVRLKAGITPPAGLRHISLSIGEPQAPTPGFITAELTAHLHGLARYPQTRGSAELRQAIAQWLTRRFELPPCSLDAERHVLPVNGTREALFALAQCVVDRSADPLVLMPNPFYQIYEGAAVLSGARPFYLNTTAATDFVPDFEAVPAAVWQRCQLLYLCSPGNPTGAMLSMAAMRRVIELADEYDFVIASDECYSEIYADEARAPVGLLQAAAAMGRADFRRCVALNSLSKRSNAPGLRSGLVAGDAELISKFLLYRTYHGCAMPPPVQAASARAWEDEAHVQQNRALYREKFAAVLAILEEVTEVHRPPGSFYLWPATPGSDTEFARELYARQNVTVLPGSYLSREADGCNPGEGRLRLALVAPLEDCAEAAGRIRDHWQAAAGAT